MYAIDTNLVIGLINKKDRLNKMTTHFVKSKKPGTLFVLRAVLDETQKKYLESYNQALSEIQLICNSEDSYTEKKKKIATLPKKNKRIANFYNIIIHELKDDFSAAKFTYLRTLVLKVIKNLIPVLEELIGDATNWLPKNSLTAKQKKFLKNKDRIKFSDSIDKDIFVEFTLTSFQEDLKEFFSNDLKCIKQARRAIKQFDIKGVNCGYVKPLEGKPFYELN